MTNFDVENTLKTAAILIDTREKPSTDEYKKRIEMMNMPHTREKLDYGDYSIKCTLPNGEVLDFSEVVVIERKMNIDELCLCFGKERKRFKAEFERAKADGCKVYLLIENATWEHVFAGKYRSRYNRTALIASILAWIPRYNMVPIMCKSETSGKLIKNILLRELKEYLINMEAGEGKIV